MNSFPQTETTFQFQLPTHEIEMLATPAPENHDQHITVIICHPHPLFEGTMHNKVVTMLAKTFHTLGVRTVRFNFRGVGKSSGKYAEGIGETEDVIAIAHWIKTVCPNDKLWLAGFSFGAFVALRAAEKLHPAQLITVAPPVVNFNFDFALNTPITSPWILVQGENDEIVAPEAVFNWAEKLNPKPTIIRMKNTSHFFHGKLTELRDKLLNALVPSPAGE